MATTGSLARDLLIAAQTPRILIVEATPGPARRRWLEALPDKSANPVERAFSVSCDFGSGGPWGGVSGLFAEVFPEIQSQRPDLVERHSLELVSVLPRLRRSLTVRNPSLTDLAAPEEKTRNYAADRAFRVVHGLIDLLDSWKSGASADAAWAIACDDFDLAGAMSRCFFAELMRRRAELMNLRLLIGVGPGGGEEVRASFKAGPPVQVAAADLADEPFPAPDENEAARIAHDLEQQIGGDRIEMQINLPQLIRLWELAGRPDKLLRAKFFGLETYDTLGLYEDALRYGSGVLAMAHEHAPDDHQLQWAIVFKLLMSHIGLQDVQSSLALAESEGMKTTERNAGWRAHLLYLIAMFHARFSTPRDLVKGEQYLDLALETIQSANQPAGVLHFQSVFNRNGLAMIRTFQGRFQEAIELCQDGIARLNAHLGADEHRLHRSVLVYNIAQVYVATGSLAEAIEHYSAAIAMDPNYSEYYNERGNIFLRLDRLDEARADYLRAIDLSPPYFEVFANLGQCFRRMGRMSEAIEAYSRALDLQPNHLLALLGRAKANEEIGRRDAAIADYTAALAESPEEWEANASRGVLYYEAGDLTGSLRDFDRAIELRADRPDLYNNRAIVLADLGRYRQSENDITVALSLLSAENDKSELQTLLESVRRKAEGEMSAAFP